MPHAWPTDDDHRHTTQRRPKAADGTRTRDLVLTKDALYQLSYSSAAKHALSPWSRPPFFGYLTTAITPQPIIIQIGQYRPTLRRVKRNSTQAAVRLPHDVGPFCGDPFDRLPGAHTPLSGLR